MKLKLTILAFIVAVQGTWDYGVRVRYGFGLNPGSTFFFNIPSMLENAVSAGWIQTDRYDGAPMTSLKMLCYKDHVVCAMYDDTDNIAGVQVSILAEKFSGAIYNWTKQGFTNWNTTVNGTSKSFWTKCVYFVSDETLAKSQEERLTARAVHNQTLQENMLIVEGFNKELMQINSNASDITTTTLFTKQACFPWMGHHYYYNMSSTTVCSETTLLSWFPLVYSDEVIGVGFYVPGNLTIDNGERDWFERSGKTAVQTNVPDGPECMYDIAESPGVVTMHIYFIDKPWLITCVFED